MKDLHQIILETLDSLQKKREQSRDSSTRIFVRVSILLAHVNRACKLHRVPELRSLDELIEHCDIIKKQRLVEEERPTLTSIYIGDQLEGHALVRADDPTTFEYLQKDAEHYKASFLDDDDINRAYHSAVAEYKTLLKKP